MATADPDHILGNIPDDFAQEFLNEYFSRISSCLPAALAMYLPDAHRASTDAEGICSRGSGREQINSMLLASPLATGTWAVSDIQYEQTGQPDTILISAVVSSEEASELYKEHFVVRPPPMSLNQCSLSNFTFWHSVIVSDFLSVCTPLRRGIGTDIVPDGVGEMPEEQFGAPLHSLAIEDDTLQPPRLVSQPVAANPCELHLEELLDFASEEDLLAALTPQSTMTQLLNVDTLAEQQQHTTTTTNEDDHSPIGVAEAQLCSELREAVTRLSLHSPSCMETATEPTALPDDYSLPTTTAADRNPSQLADQVDLILGRWSAPTSPRATRFNDSGLGSLLKVIDSSKNVQACNLPGDTAGDTAAATGQDDFLETAEPLPPSAMAAGNDAMIETLYSLLLDNPENQAPRLCNPRPSLPNIFSTTPSVKQNQLDDLSSPVLSRSNWPFIENSSMTLNVPKARTAPSSPVVSYADREPVASVLDSPPLKQRSGHLASPTPRTFAVSNRGSAELRSVSHRAFCDSFPAFNEQPPQILSLPPQSSAGGGGKRSELKFTSVGKSAYRPTVGEVITPTPKQGAGRQAANGSGNGGRYNTPPTQNSPPNGSSGGGGANNNTNTNTNQSALKVNRGKGADKGPTFWGMWEDERDRMVYVSWLPRVARANDRSDKKKCELQLKEFIAARLGFKNLDKVLLFPPSSAHCKLIFRSEYWAQHFLTTYGGLESTEGPERWKRAVCEEYSVSIKDGIESTRVKVIWADQTKNDVDPALQDSKDGFQNFAGTPRPSRPYNGSTPRQSNKSRPPIRTPQTPTANPSPKSPHEDQPYTAYRMPQHGPPTESPTSMSAEDVPLQRWVPPQVGGGGGSDTGGPHQAWPAFPLYGSYSSGTAPGGSYGYGPLQGHQSMHPHSQPIMYFPNYRVVLPTRSHQCFAGAVSRA